MKIFVNNIQLNNWFNFRGEFEDNNFEFKNGVNIIAADNDGGKTKLFNAFKWLISDEVILMSQNRATVQKISARNLKKVFNDIEFLNLNLNENSSIGVRLSFTIESPRSGRRTYRLLKKIKVRKDVEELVQVGDVYSQIRKLEPRTNSWGPSTDLDFDRALEQIIPSRYRRFLFIEGEQLSEMTNLEGDSLRRTIYSIVNLQRLDSYYDKTIKIKTFSSDELQKAINNDEGINNERKTQLQNRIDLEQNIIDVNKQLSQIDERLTIEKEIKERFETASERSRENKRLVEQYYKLKGNVENSEARVETLKLAYIKSYMNNDEFSMVRAFNKKSKFNLQLEDIQSKFRTFVSKRRSELDDQLSEEERDMMLSLEKSQPKPEILERMVNEDHCFVCNSTLNEPSKDYINNKLIPFFRNEDNEDILLNKIQDLYSFFQKLEVSSRKYNSDDIGVFSNKEDVIANEVTNKNESQKKLELFIEERGNPKKQEEDDVNIETYNKAITNIRDIEEKISELEKHKASEKLNLDNINKFLKDTKEMETSESESVTNAKHFNEFFTDLNEVIKEIQGAKYAEFAKKLSELSTERFQRLFSYNEARNNRVHVELNERGENQYDFKIQVLNRFNQNTEDAGGANQAVRRVSVVLALLDMADTRVSYPFILDAPVSRFSEDNKLEFFKTMIEDSADNNKAIEQVIFTSMDIISAKDSQENDRLCLNDLGKELKEIVNNDSDNQVIGIWRNKVQNEFV